MLKLQKLLQSMSFEKAKAILTLSPYNFKIQEDDNYVLFAYNQIETDMSLPEAIEARGIIFEKNADFTPVCVPFFKFWNYGESKASVLDHSSLSIYEKIDGSLIKFWWSSIYDKWIISTNNTISAYSAGLPDNPIFTTFGDLVSDILKQKGITNLNSIFDKGNTYMFELTSIYNKVVIRHTESNLTFLGYRDNSTLQEFEPYDIYLNDEVVLKKVKKYPMMSMDDVLKACEIMHGEQEGFVLVDKNFNRAKVKSPFYVTLHHAKDNGQFTSEKAIRIIQINEVQEFLTYFPEFEPFFNEIEVMVNNYIDDMANCLRVVLDGIDKSLSRKDIALQLKQYKATWYGFMVLDKILKHEVYEMPKDCFEKMDASKAAKFIGEKAIRV